MVKVLTKNDLRRARCIIEDIRNDRCIVIEQVVAHSCLHLQSMFI